jgi:hypothetical protein
MSGQLVTDKTAGLAQTSRSFGYCVSNDRGQPAKGSIKTGACQWIVVSTGLRER